MSTEAPSGLAATDPACIAAVDDAIQLLDSLGHSVVRSEPAALQEVGLMDQFSAVMMSCLRAELGEIAALAGRPITADDVEPTTWLYLEGSGGYDGGAYVEAVAEMHRWTRRMVSWWLDDGFDLLLTPTIAEPPPVLGDVGNQDDGGLNAAARSIPFAAYCRGVQRHRPARDVGAAVLERPACRSACSSWPRRSGKTCCSASPGSSKQARPWANRRPSVHA